MGKIATEQDVYNIGQTGTPIANKCCTKQRMEALGCTGTNGIENYASNRLVSEGNYIKNVIGSFKLVFLSERYKPVFHVTNATVTDLGDDNYLVEIINNNWTILIEFYASSLISTHIIAVKEQTLDFSMKRIIGTGNCNVSYSYLGISASSIDRSKNEFGYSIEFNFGNTVGQINCTGYILKN